VGPVPQLLAVLRERSDSTRRIPPRSVSFAGPYRRHVRSFATGIRRTLRSQSRTFLAEPSTIALLRRATRGLPGSWVNPHAPLATLFDPGEARSSGQYDERRLSTHRATAPTSSTLDYFEADSRSSRARCLRFAGWIAPSPRKTRFRLVASLYRARLLTCKVHFRRFRDSIAPLHRFPSSRLLLAQCTCSSTSS
jgi:hypothetical protein